jgi:hypothetical protein
MIFYDFLMTGASYFDVYRRPSEGREGVDDESAKFLN